MDRVRWIEAVASAERLEPDVIILDLGMPKLTGYEAARAIRARPLPKRPMIIALSGYDRPQDRHQSREAGFDLHIAKPADYHVLKQTIDEFSA